MDIINDATNAAKKVDDQDANPSSIGCTHCQEEYGEPNDVLFNFFKSANCL
jgi:hypothetical protein